VWRVIAISATVVALAALGIVYQRDVGTSLIWLGETLAGKTKASAVEPDKQAAPAIPNAAADSNSQNAAPDPPPNQNVSDRQERTSEPRKDFGGSGAAEEPSGVSTDGNGRGESVLERQGMPPKTEAAFNAGDSVESLWGAVQAGSIAAEVSLAERFARGEGVNKNCEQAKVLMKAAAERGNREARLRLYEMETGGCR
jgi:TPR repeat protein